MRQRLWAACPAFEFAFHGHWSAAGLRTGAHSMDAQLNLYQCAAMLSLGQTLYSWLCVCIRYPTPEQCPLQMT